MWWTRVRICVLSNCELKKKNKTPSISRKNFTEARLVVQGTM